ncbi:MAG: nuclear transport factor 2 family protein [Gemmatimonadetes bacterium]|nr:nuclear transport factor 2 family protein [Gemmatimonadota bacterium]
MDAIVLAVYDVISGPAGEQRDWDRMRSLFAPEARLIPSDPRQSGGFGHRMLPLEDYISTSGSVLEQNGFFEVEIHRVTEEFGNIAHLFSTYESRHKADDPEPFVRGINSFQLYHDGERWWILNIFWTDERTAPIPPRYLP